IVAMDQAGNLSDPSNEICRTLDNRAPQAVILQPADRTRFEFPVRVVAFTPDTDIAAVQIQYRASGTPEWQDLGAADAAAPYEVTLDPATLPGPGPYEVRAVATDQGGRTDPAPATVTVVYGDTTAPAPPQGVAVLVDGRSVSLTWSANTEDDLAGYHVFRGGVR